MQEQVTARTQAHDGRLEDLKEILSDGKGCCAGWSHGPSPALPTLVEPGRGGAISPIQRRLLPPEKIPYHGKALIQHQCRACVFLERSNGGASISGCVVYCLHQDRCFNSRRGPSLELRGMGNILLPRTWRAWVGVQ